MHHKSGQDLICQSTVHSIYSFFESFPNNKSLDSSKLKDNNFEFDGIVKKYSKQVENTAGKGEIALYEQFLLFQAFSKDLYSRHVKTRAYLGKGQTNGLEGYH